MLLFITAYCKEKKMRKLNRVSLKPNVKNASHQQYIREFSLAFCLFYRNVIFLAHVQFCRYQTCCHLVLVIGDTTKAVSDFTH